MLRLRIESNHHMTKYKISESNKRTTTGHYVIFTHFQYPMIDI